MPDTTSLPSVDALLTYLDDARDLARTYAEDGALVSAARVLSDCSNELVRAHFQRAASGASDWPVRANVIRYAGYMTDAGVLHVTASLLFGGMPFAVSGRFGGEIQSLPPSVWADRICAMCERMRSELVRQVIR